LGEKRKTNEKGKKKDKANEARFLCTQSSNFLKENKRIKQNRKPLKEGKRRGGGGGLL